MTPSGDGPKETDLRATGQWALEERTRTNKLKQAKTGLPVPRVQSKEIEIPSRASGKQTGERTRGGAPTQVQKK